MMLGGRDRSIAVLRLRSGIASFSRDRIAKRRDDSRIRESSNPAESFALADFSIRSPPFWQKIYSGTKDACRGVKLNSRDVHPSSRALARSLIVLRSCSFSLYKYAIRSICPLTRERTRISRVVRPFHPQDPFFRSIPSSSSDEWLRRAISPSSPESVFFFIAARDSHLGLPRVTVPATTAARRSSGSRRTRLGRLPSPLVVATSSDVADYSRDRVEARGDSRRSRASPPFLFCRLRLETSGRSEFSGSGISCPSLPPLPLSVLESVPIAIRA